MCTKGNWGKTSDFLSGRITAVCQENVPSTKPSSGFVEWEGLLRFHADQATNWKNRISPFATSRFQSPNNCWLKIAKVFGPLRLRGVGHPEGALRPWVSGGDSVEQCGWNSEGCRPHLNHIEGFSYLTCKKGRGASKKKGTVQSKTETIFTYNN